MNVNDLVVIVLNKIIAKNSQESGKNNQVNIVGIDEFLNLCFPAFLSATLFSCESVVLDSG